MDEWVLSGLRWIEATIAHWMPSPPKSWYWEVAALVAGAALVSLGGSVLGAFGPLAKHVAQAPFKVIAARWERRKQQKKWDEQRRESNLRSRREFSNQLNEFMREQAPAEDPEKPPPRVVHSIHDLPEGVTDEQVAWADPGNVPAKEAAGRRRVLVSRAEYHFHPTLH